MKRVKPYLLLACLVVPLATAFWPERPEAIHPHDYGYLELPVYELEPLDERWLEPPEGFAASIVDTQSEVELPGPGAHVAHVFSIEARSSDRTFVLDVPHSPGLELHASEGGSVLLIDSETSEELYIFRVPIGIDADGRRIDYRYHLADGRLTLGPRHTWQMEKASYPVHVHAGVAVLEWSEALVKAGENCLGCTRDGDIVSVHPAGWNWGVKERQRFAIVQVPKLSARERAEIRARSLLVADPATPEEYRRVADTKGLFRYAIDYTALATDAELERIRDREREGPVLDAREHPVVIRAKTNLHTSILHDPFRHGVVRRASLLDVLTPWASAATVITRTIGTAGRDYSTVGAWEAGQEGNLVGADTIEKGEMYDDGQFDESNVVIDGSITDADHFMWLTVAPTERHDGTAHNGASFTGVHVTASSGNIFEASDDYTLVEWIIFHDWGSGVTRKRALDMSQDNAVARYNIFWGGSSPHGTATALTVDRDNITAYNNIIYALPGGSGGGDGIATEPNEDGFVAFNNTVFNCLNGFFSDAGTSTVTARNNMVVFNGFDYVGPFDGASSHNVDSDGSAPGSNTMTILPPALSTEFVSTSFPEDFHLLATATVRDQGTDLTASMAPFDIDLEYRGMTTWDRGADEFAGTTEVTLAGLSATRFGDRVAIEWETAAELDNLGFHIYRARSLEGPYERITETLIPGLGSSPSGASYRHVDVHDQATHYKLEDVDTRGRVEVHGPVVVSVPSTGEDAPDNDSFVTFGDPSANEIIVRRDARGVTLELITGGVSGVPQPDGTVHLEVPGLDAGSALPMKRVWVEALAGRKVSVSSVKKESIEAIDGWTLGSDELDVVAESGGTARLTKRARRARRAAKSGARIVETAYQGEVKKALVELSPIAWNPRARRISITRCLKVRLSFTGRDPNDRFRARPSQRRRRVATRLIASTPGLHQVRYEDVFRGRRVIATRRVRLSRLGSDVAYHVEPDPRRFGPGSTLFFVAADPRKNPYGDGSTYELEVGIEGTRMEVEASGSTGPALRHYWGTVDREENHLYQPALVNAPDRWLWDAISSHERKTYAFDVSELTVANAAPRLGVWLQGGSDLEADPDHHVRVFVNDALAGHVRWDGKAAQQIELDVPSLRNGTNTLAIENVGDTASSYSMVMLDRFAVHYPRRLVRGGLDGRFDSSGIVDISGLSEPRVIDVTTQPRWVVASATFEANEGAHYLVVDGEAVSTPTVVQVEPGTLKTRRNRADYLVIGPESFLRTARPLLRQRRAQGLRVRAVSLTEIYSAFGFGEPRPEALRDFIAYAYHQWRGELRYVVLLGDGSYDFKNYMGTDVRNHVPPRILRTRYLWTASDPSYAAVVGDDDVPDLAIGRLPASNDVELETMIDKILAYESGAPAEPRFVLVADDADDAGNFRMNADELAHLAPSEPAVKIYLDELGPAAARDAIIDAFNEGASVVSYVGHGGINLWANENIFNTRDAASLGTPSELPIVLTMNCLNGFYHFPFFDSLSETMLTSERAGAVAAFSPSGLSSNASAHIYHRELLTAILQRRHERLGDAIVDAQARFATYGATPELLSIYHLFGDPALLLH